MKYEKFYNFKLPWKRILSRQCQTPQPMIFM